MIRINLLPIRQLKKRKQLKNELLILFASFICVILILAGTAFTVSQKISTKKKTVAQLQSKKRSYQPILQKIKQAEQEKALLETKLETIKKLKLGSQLPVRILDEIAKLTPPERIWLKSLKLSTGSLLIQGIALDNATIAQYMQKISSSPYFSLPDLSRTTSTKIGQQTLKSFSLKILTKNPLAQKKGSPNTDTN